jgi:hypothetical protein
MKKSSIFYIALVCLCGSLFMSACKTKAPEKEEIELPALRASSIYRLDSVEFYINQYGTQHQAIAAEYFKKGEALADKNPQKATWNMKRAITLHPQLSYYKKLGEHLMKSRDYQGAQYLYNFLVSKSGNYNENGEYETYYLFEKPSEDEYYNWMLSGILADNHYSSYVVYQAYTDGINLVGLKNRLLKDERFKYNPADEAFKNFMFAFLSEEEQQNYCHDPANFQAFITRIPDSSNVFSIDQRTVSNFDYSRFYYEGEGEDNPLTYVESNFLKERKDEPEMWLTYNCTHRMKISNDVQAIIYAVDTSALACPREMRHIYHKLATYNNAGEVLDTKVVAWQAGNTMASMTYDNGKVTVNQFNRSWNKPYDKEDFDNELVKTEPAGETTYMITSDGKITEGSVQ